MYTGIHILAFILGVSSVPLTLKKSIKMYSNAIIDGILEVPNHGYKLKKESFEKTKGPFEMESKIKTNLPSRLALCIPGLNIYLSKKRSENVKKQIFNSLIENDAVIPMTEEEKKNYSSLNTKNQKLMFLSVVSTKVSDSEHITGFIGDIPIVTDYSAIYIKNDKLLPLSYSLEEVKKLNSTTNLYYQLGKINDVNTAIIGLPDKEIKFNRVKFNNKKSKNDFKRMTEEEAKNKKFIVYPFSDNLDELNDCIENIRKERKTKDSISLYHSHNMKEIYNKDYFSNTSSNISNSNEKGPVLIKTLYKK